MCESATEGLGISKLTATVTDDGFTFTFNFDKDRTLKVCEAIRWRGTRMVTEFSTESELAIGRMLADAMNMVNELKRTGAAY